jgi:hypothetical protein
MTDAISGITIAAGDIWQASLECDRIRVGSSVFFKTNLNYYKAVNNTPNFSPLDLDDDLIFAVNIDSTVWRYDSTI